MPRPQWKLVIHGGAGAMRPAHGDSDHEQRARQGLRDALDAGAAVLADGGKSVDAVEAAVRVLEDDACFNAGRGSTLNAEGLVELDAAIMDGSNRRAGAVAGLKTTRAPISLARILMERGPHVFLSYEGADRMAHEAGLEQVDNSWFVTGERRRQLDELMAKGGFDADVKYGTVGAVAVDTSGHIAAATSTGGLTAKQWGRIGDSPLIGAGTYADDRSAAVSATGSGEYFIRAVAAHQLAERMRLAGESLQEALDGVLEDIRELGGLGGMIAVAPTGEAAWGFTTRAMYRGIADAETRNVAIYAEEDER
ncbi:isoaspartyl peptidase/L-asparaginase [Sphingomonas sp. SM33]|uniref:Isoaspartyl peptidase/L-asparaginase n=1 Tax=Sphingomonas telluris TaxID=2907998 RepID=A0ABS9VP62_9SPHN|nr:isoaspartyl peptidase/L-asparaginase [Sphingomonas telluris]MCH8616768.1 isoaspartyl peptidase/L-asparaginase [Sphingomonas telluris]